MVKKKNIRLSIMTISDRHFITIWNTRPTTTVKKQLAKIINYYKKKYYKNVYKTRLIKSFWSKHYKYAFHRKEHAFTLFILLFF